MKKMARLLSIVFTFIWLIQAPLYTLAANQIEQNMDITATIEPITYYVTLDKTSFDFGTLSAIEDASIDFTVTVSFEEIDGGTLRVQFPKTSYFYLDGDSTKDSIKITNSFGAQDFTEDGSATGTLSIDKSDVAKVKSGNYTGSISYYTKYFNAGVEPTDITSSSSGTSLNAKLKNDNTSDEESELTGTLKDVSFKKANKVTEDSMCNPLFYPKASLTANGNGYTTVSIYCVDPVPAYPNSGAPVKTMIVSGTSTDVSITGTDSSSNSYTTSPSSGSYATTADINSKTKQLEYAASTFIPTAGIYDSDEITFTVPSTAIANNKLFVNVYVGTVMNTWQQLQIQLEDVEDWDPYYTKADGTVHTEFDSTISGGSVSGLESYAKEHADEGYFTFTAKESTDSSDLNAIGAITKYMSSTGVSGTTTYYNFGITSSSEGNAVTDLADNVIEIALKYKLTSGKSINVYRAHGDDNEVKLFGKLSARATSSMIDGTFYYDSANSMLYIYSSKFSVYAITESSSSSSSTSSTKTVEDGTYIAPVTMKKYDDFSSTSMCNALFYDYAEITVSGTDAEVSVYVIDPIPNYSDSGVPLSDITVHVDSDSYSASLSTANHLGLDFAYSEQFISSAGTYYADPITFTVPIEAVTNSSNGNMYMTAYVNAVMKSTQSFYMVFGSLEEGSISSKTVTKTTTSSTESKKLDDGSYIVEMGALKTNTDDASMMEDYMYKEGNLVVSGSTAKLTVFIQHTVAGKDGGGPKYLKYNGVESTKVDNALVMDGVSYDSFTISCENPVLYKMTVDMFINAMSMEVSCRLVLGLDNVKSGQVTSDGSAVTAVSKSATSSKTSSKSASNSSGATDGEDDELVTNSDAYMVLNDESGEDSGGFLHFAGKSVFVIVIICVIAAGILGLLGYYLYLRYKKRNML